eukprot:GHVN01012283.1.p1 GENE.GHVN01012283.1~~GHVN01012283.1.p1  ORF type:complete len:194 (+),score=43.62 GHVN01012283.1:711-1292(+)
MFPQLLNQRKKSDDAFSYEVIVVDDGSNDDTSGVVMRMVKETKQWPANSVRVIKLKRNRGKGFSVRLGMLASRGHYVLMMDADGASRFEDMVSLERGLVPELTTVSAEEERRKREMKDNKGEGESTLESGIVALPGRILPSPLPINCVVQIAFGSRRTHQTDEEVKRGVWRRLLMYIFYALVQLLVGTDIKVR